MSRGTDERPGLVAIEREFSAANAISSCADRSTVLKRGPVGLAELRSTGHPLRLHSAQA